MKLAARAAVVLVFVGSWTPVFAQERLTDDQFTLTLGKSGIASLKHTHDAFDSTGFESTHALARWALDRMNVSTQRRDGALAFVTRDAAHRFLEKQIRANIADRGWLETAYYLLGSDYRAGMGGSYTLSYMSQMGGWSVLDYALHYAGQPAEYLRLGYAS
jgi:hypothetical protein